jgi:hypothetical protein
MLSTALYEPSTAASHGPQRRGSLPPDEDIRAATLARHAEDREREDAVEREYSAGRGEPPAYSL